jgi:exonuclease VII large subunit
MEYEKLMKVLETDSEEGIIDLTVERIKELGTENAEKQKVIDEQQKKLDALNERARLLEEQAELKKTIAELDEKEAALKEALSHSVPHQRKLYYVDSQDSELGRLKLARHNMYQRGHGIPDDKDPRILNNRNSTVLNDAPRRKLLHDDSDDEIEELKKKRMQIYESSHSK